MTIYCTGLGTVSGRDYAAGQQPAGYEWPFVEIASRRTARRRLTYLSPREAALTMKRRGAGPM